MQTLSFFTTFLPLPSKPLLKPPIAHKFHFPSKPFKPHLPRPFLLPSYSSDEYPVGDDDAFLASFGPKEKESEEEARRRNWIEKGWAPWEEILTPEADFARKSLNEGEEVPLQSPEAIEAFRMLSPKYRKEKIAEMGLTEDEYYAKQFEIKGEIPEPLETLWSAPLVLGLVPPRDWPPRGWEVDKEELEFIRGAHKLHSAESGL
ncbi:protein PLASTID TRANSCRIPTIONALLY ACTIVE 10 [Sesamum angolense]|uniref:Protein PLASTID TRANSCRIPTIONALLY ACTIVE 10 n=1 Tax=Sesamum angolense TaxID=2727404 RepID=A0AAE2BS05_9LAMI|nr:protein PLASTID TRANSCRIPTIONALLY ACTIVE 10 [Sesamum angolense]